MFDAGSIVAKVVADVSGFKQSLTQVTTDVKKYSTNFKSKLDSLGSSITNHIGGIQNMAAKLTMVGGAAAATAKQFINLASDQAEVINKTKEVFGKASDAIIQKSKESAKAVGASTTQYLNMASGIGNLIVPMGFLKDEAAAVSSQMVTLAADLGSFNNTTTEDALSAINQGFRGETEALRRYGVQLSAARVEEEVLASGMAKTKDAITSKMKAQATLNLIMRDTIDAQGDFGRTSDGFANQNKIIRADIADLSTEIGTVLLPMALEMTKVFNKVVGVFSNLSDENKKLLAYFIAFIAGIGMLATPLLVITTLLSTLITAFSALSTVVAFLGGPITAVIVALALMYTAWKTNFLGIRDITAEAWQGIKDTFSLGVLFIKDAFYAALNSITLVFDATFEGIKETFKSVVNYIVDQINALIGLVNGVTSKLSFGKVKGGISTIPRLAEGGIVTRPTLAMIGEGGESEAVIPLSKLNSMGGAGGVNIIIQDSLVADEESAKNLLEKAFNSMKLSL